MLMSHPMDYFERIFIINLPSRTDRQAEIAAQLNAVGLSLAAPNVELFAAVRPDAPEGFPSIGARGCFMSHLGVLRTAQRLGLQRVAIFEDDLDFATDFNSRIQPLLEQLANDNWSMFYGGYHVEQALRGQPSAELLEAQPNELIGTTHFVTFQGAAIAAAVRYLEAILARPAGDPDGGPMHVDGAYNWFRRANPQFKTVLAIPELGFQRASRTDIHDLRWYDTTPLIRNAVAGLRWLKNAQKRR
jgi:glycosyl transferase family 25